MVISYLPFFSAELNAYGNTRCTRPLYSPAIERRLLNQWNIVWCTSVDSEKHYYCMARNILADWQFWEQSANISSAIKLHSVMSSLQIIAFMCTRPAGRCASLIIEFSIESCVRGHHFSKEFCIPKVGEELACLSTRGRQSKRRVCSHCKDWHNENNPVKCNNDLSSFHLHFIITFILTDPKLAHGPVKFPTFCYEYHYGKTLITKVNPAKWHFSAIRQNIFPPKFPAIQYVYTLNLHFC